jgi:hypothetical protein
MIGQEVNSPAQKLLPSARRKRGALQGVNVLVNCSHVVLGLNGRSGKSVSISPANKRRDRADYVVKTTGLIGRQAGQAHSPPGHKAAGYLNGKCPRSELSRQVAVDFESDADFHECGSCPVHSLLPPFH